MSDRFRPVSTSQLAAWTFNELERRDSLFNIPRRAFFVPGLDQRFRLRQHDVPLETPFGVAAGPHTQLAQNIVAAWLTGARVIELKTVQTLDEIDVHKPCIDVEDEGYNVEWSQELRIRQSFDEYLRAWVLIHALHRRLGFPGERPAVLFNMSVGYDYAGIHAPNVQWYLDAMADASAWLPECVEAVARYEPAVRDIEIPTRISDTVTLSTMHGCPPGEIERIARYLLEERHLHTSVKCNPTLLGAERVRGIVAGLGYSAVRIPDEAFAHDLAWADAVPMFRRLAEVAAGAGLTFGLKLSNTLEVENTRTAFDRDETMYMSGRALHPATVNLAAIVADGLPGIPLSFAGGADAFNVASLIASGMTTVTVTSDLLKTGGYLRLLQYAERLDEAFDEVEAADTASFIRLTALANGMAGDAGDVAACARFNLRRYAEATRSDWRYRKASFRTGRTKSARALEPFDCIQAPCVETCPIDQRVPQYLDAVRRGEFDAAARIIREDNPLAAILGRSCDRACEAACVRTHLDQPLAIRHVKRFAMDCVAGVADAPPATDRPAASGKRVAIVGGGPAGLGAAESLARAGVSVTVFEAREHAGGMPAGAIPAYRLPEGPLMQDLAIVERLGVEIRYGAPPGGGVTVENLRADGFDAVFVAVGAQIGRGLGLPGEDASGVVDGVEFLRRVREKRPATLGRRVGVVGGGDSAMDCARSALRRGAGTVSLIYRRTIDKMPADPEEIEAALEEGVEIVELARPVSLHVENGALTGIDCLRTEYRGERDASGRPIAFDVPGSAFEIPLDSLIVAIGQQAALDCFGSLAPRLTPTGYLATDPETLETSIAGVYAGGDASAHGPASIVRAAADGKRAARAILAAFGGDAVTGDAGRDTDGRERIDVQQLTLQRGRRRYRVPVATMPLEHRSGFEETVLGYTRDEAMAEASRCLRCDQLCSLCVSVCPNLALFTYEVEPARVTLPLLGSLAGGLVPAGTSLFATGQRYQVAVLADLCNECGTCVTACPTAGAPYRDKPRLYLRREDFEAETSNAFLLLGSGAMEGRFGAVTHRVDVDGVIRYSSPRVDAVLDSRTFEVLDTRPGQAAGDGADAGGAGSDARISLEPAAVMATLLRGLSESCPHLMAMADADRTATTSERPNAAI